MTTAVVPAQGTALAAYERPQDRAVDIELKQPVVGRLRLGGPKRPVIRNGAPLIKNGKQVMGFGEALTHFRATAEVREDIEELAEAYGDPQTIAPWESPDGPQWQTVLTASTLPIALLPMRDTLVGPRYEAYNASHAIQRWCDGQICMVPNLAAKNDKRQQPWLPRPCTCDNSDADACARVTRLKVVLRGIPFRGVWDIVCHGNYAAQHWPTVVLQAEYLSRQQEGRPIAATLRIKEQRGRSAVYGPYKPKVPELRLEEAFTVSALPATAEVPQLSASAKDGPEIIDASFNEAPNDDANRGVGEGPEGSTGAAAGPSTQPTPHVEDSHSNPTSTEEGPRVESAPAGGQPSSASDAWLDVPFGTATGEQRNSFWKACAAAGLPVGAPKVMAARGLTPEALNASTLRELLAVGAS